MPEILTESFCERCGTRYTFESAAPRAAKLKGIRVLSRGLKNFVLSDDTSIDEAMAAARSETDRELTSQQLDAFHKTFNFCMSCRQYTCGNCWNEAEGRCLTCAPHLGHEILPAPFPDVPARGLIGLENGVNGNHADEGGATNGEANGHGSFDPADALAWPTMDLERDAFEHDPIEEIDAAARLAAIGAYDEPAADAPTSDDTAPEGRVAPADAADAERPDLDPAEESGAAMAAPPEVVDSAPPEVVDWAPPEVVDSAAPEALDAVAQDVSDAAVPAASADATETIAAEGPAPSAVEGPAMPKAAAMAVPPAPPVLPLAPSPARIDPSDVTGRAVAAAAQTVDLLRRFRPGQSLDAEIEAYERAHLTTDGGPSPEPAPETPREPEPVAAAAGPVVAEPTIEPEPAPTPDAAEPAAAQAPEPESAPAPAPAAREDVVPQPTWRIVAHDADAPSVAIPPAGASAHPDAISASAEPQWPAQPEWPSQRPASGLAFLGRPAVPTGGLESLWAESAREVTTAPAPLTLGGAPARASGGVQPCVSCGLSLSATARFCRRCGTAQS